MNQRKCEAPGLPEDRIQEIARTTRNPRRSVVEDVLRIAAKEAYAAGRASMAPEDAGEITTVRVPFGYVLVEISRINNLTEGIRRLVVAGSIDARSMAADAALLLEANVRNARKS